MFLTLSLIWLLWKTSPLLRDQGGFKELFHLKPIGKKTAKKEQDESTEKETEESTEEIDEDEDLFGEESLADESADFGGEIDVSEEER